MMRDTIDMARLNRRVQTFSLPAAPGCHWVRASSVGELEMLSWSRTGEVFEFFVRLTFTFIYHSFGLTRFHFVSAVFSVMVWCL